MAEDRHLRSILLGIASGLPMGDPTRRQILLALHTETAAPVAPVADPVAPPAPVAAPPPPVPVVAPVPAPVPQAAPIVPSGPVVVQAPPPAPIVIQGPAVAPAPPPPPVVPIPVPVPEVVPEVVPEEVAPGSTGEGPVGPPKDPIPIQTRRAFENEFLPEMERMLESSTPEMIRQTFIDLVDTAVRTKNDYYVTLKYYQALNQTDPEFFEGLKRVIREWNT